MDKDGASETDQFVGGEDVAAATVTLVPEPNAPVTTVLFAGTVYGVEPTVIVSGFIPA
jgi:hypothetical protein